MRWKQCQFFILKTLEIQKMSCHELSCKKKSAASEGSWPHRIGRFEDDSSYSAQLAPAQWHVLTKFSAVEILTTKLDLIP